MKLEPLVKIILTGRKASYLSRWEYADLIGCLGGVHTMAKMTATATATFTVTLTKREATFTLFMVPWKMANSRYFFFRCFSLVVPLARVGIVFEPFPVSLFSVEAAQGSRIEE